MNKEDAEISASTKWRTHVADSQSCERKFKQVPLTAIDLDFDRNSRNEALRGEDCSAEHEKSPCVPTSHGPTERQDINIWRPGKDTR
jgi:hypothetical protein